MIDRKKISKTLFYIFFSIVVVSLLVAFVFIALDVKGNRFWEFDKHCIDFALSIRSGWLTVIFTIITNLVNPIVIGIIGFCILIFAKNLRKYSFALFLNMGLISLLNLVLKYFFVRSRPDEALQIILEKGYSFPSGHTMFAVAFYGFLIYLIWNLSWKKRIKSILSIISVLIIIFVSISRIYLGVHYATDVIGGLCVSIAYILLYIFIVSRTKQSHINIGSEYKSHSFVGGFKYAVKGIVTALQVETNLLIQFSAGMLVMVFGVALRISPVEWCICIVVSFLVLALEFVNTAIENLCDKITMENDEQIKKVKDIAAGAVLTVSICAAIVACIIFVPKLPFLFK